MTRLVEIPAQFDDRSFDQFAGAFAEAAGGAGTGRAAFAGRAEAARRTRAAPAVVVPHPRHLAADHAALGFVAQAELRVVLLLLRGEDEIFVAVLALQRLVGEWHAGIHPGNVRTALRYSLQKDD
jgi:hypothetical protein